MVDLSAMRGPEGQGKVFLRRADLIWSLKSTGRQAVGTVCVGLRQEKEARVGLAREGITLETIDLPCPLA